MKPDPRCIIDRDRPCRGCIASSPADCPYPYLLADDDERDDAGRRSHDLGTVGTGQRQPR